MTPKLMVTAIGAVMLLGVGAYAAAQPPANVHSASTTPANIQNAIPAWGPKNLKDVALQMAANLGDSRPTDIRFIKTNRETAAKFLDNSRVHSHDHSYIVVMHGNFTHEKAFMPPGAKAPTGNTLALIVRASDGAVTDLVLNNQSYSNIGLLGPVTDIPSN